MTQAMFLLVLCLFTTAAQADLPLIDDCYLLNSQEPTCASDYIACNRLDFNDEECSRYSDFLPLNLLTRKIREPLVQLNQNFKQLTTELFYYLTAPSSGTIIDDQTVDLSLNLLRHLYSPSENLVFSPHSIVTALTMTLLGAEGHSRRQLMETLFGSKDERLVEQFITQHRDLTKYNAKQLTMGNFLYSDKSFPLKSEYKRNLTTAFSAITKTVNFNNEASSLKSINSDVNEATHGLIPRLLTELNPKTVLVLLNTVYFKGMWAVPFRKPDNDFKSTFTKSSGEEIQIPMMHHYREEFPFFEESDGTKCLLLPYNVPHMHLALLLPPEDQPIDAFVSNLTGAFLEPLLKARLYPSSRKVYVTLPRFSISSTHSGLSNTLKSLGVSDIFSPKKANFSKLTENWKGFAVSQVLQKAIIEVNEEGTKAAAATAVSGLIPISVSIIPHDAFHFTADRPFVYALIRAPRQPSAHMQILFMGVVEDPRQE